ncbi:MAG: hypothetical protein IAB88_08310 [Bacteroidetes bacterium]|uniref:Uncharacterized protein n=1 Tax=Candidatus Limisoma faecipullorum TaxID=2840854 RepID=A0A9D9IRS3_9BACT|nr:hypothetical protein [Candidatus Limisoma faecipullorum]
MAIINRARVIRPSSRQETSSYKVDIKNRDENDDLCVTVTHESNPGFHKKFYFSAKQLHEKKSLHFDWNGKSVVWKGGIIPTKIL